MLKRLLQLPESGNLIIVMLLSLIIWFIAPHIHFGHSRPFAGSGVRAFTIGMLFSGLIAKILFTQINRHRSQFIPVVIESLRRSRSNINSWSKTAWQKSQYKFNDLKGQLHNDHKQRQLKKQPWYLVIGAPQSGKKSMLANSGLHFVKAEQYGRNAINLVNQFSEYDWWFADNAIFVDIATHNHESEQVIQKRFIKHLRKNRKSKPINGIILSFNVADLLLATHENRQAFISEITATLRELYQLLKTELPIYLTFTKCDMIAGFTEFFNDLSKEELAQVWGATLPMQECSDLNQVINRFNHEFNQLMVRLQQRITWSMDGEKNQRGRELIFDFPQQMQLLKKPISTFISELFGAIRYTNAIQLRGIYFTSAMQSGTRHNFLQAAIGNQYQLQAEPLPAQEERRESYFLQRLFNDVILNESKMLGLSLRAKKIKKWSYRATSIITPALLIIGSVGLYRAYQHTTDNLHKTNSNLAVFQHYIANLMSNDQNITHTLPALNILKTIQTQYSDNPFFANLLIANHRLHANASSALQRSVSTYFLPRVASYLENQLSNGNYNANTLYAILKGYLAFSPSDYTQATAIVAPMEFSWSKIYSHDPKIQQQLKYYLKLGSQQRLSELPLDRPLINKTRLKLQEIVPSQRAYGLLTFKSIASNLSDINLVSTVGNGFRKIFSNDHESLTVPALYSAAGYHKLYQKQASIIAQQVANDNREIGLDSNNESSQSEQRIAQQMQVRYSQSYLKHWHDVLNSLHVKPFNSLSDALSKLALLTNDQSPLSKLLDLIYDNSATITQSQLHIAQAFSKLNNFSQTSSGKYNYQQVKTTLVQLRQYLQKFTQTANPDLAEYQAAKSYIQGDMNNPIRKLSILAQHAPKPLNHWLATIAKDSWNIVMQGALRYINSAWSTDVLPTYQQQIQNRFPLNPHTDSDISIADFTHFFGNNGVLQQFFNKYLKAFINTQQPHWKSYQLSGHGLQIPHNIIHLFRAAASIRNLYFSNGSHIATLEFSVRPRTLDSHATRADLSVGAMNLDYQHGPENPVHIHWPLPANTQQSKIIISDFSDQHYVKAYLGPWSWFRLIKQANFRQYGSSNQYLLSIVLHGHEVTYVVTSSAPLAAFTLRPLQHFSLPNTL